MKKEYLGLDGHSYSVENFDLELYIASINVTSVNVVNLPGDPAFIVNYEFFAEYADGSKWLKDVAIVTGTPCPEFLASFKKQLLEEVVEVRKELKRTKLNGERVE